MIGRKSVLNTHLAYESTSSEVVQGLGDDIAGYFRLAWNGLQAGSAAIWASASAGYLKTLFVSALRSSFSPSVTVDFENISDKIGDKTAATTRLKITGMPAGQLDQAFDLLRKIVADEQARGEPLADNPTIPTPDNVTISMDNMGSSGGNQTLALDNPMQNRLLPAAPLPTKQLPSAGTGSDESIGFPGQMNNTPSQTNGAMDQLGGNPSQLNGQLPGSRTPSGGFPSMQTPIRA